MDSEFGAFLHNGPSLSPLMIQFLWCIGISDPESFLEIALKPLHAKLDYFGVERMKVWLSSEDPFQAHMFDQVIQIHILGYYIVKNFQLFPHLFCINTFDKPTFEFYQQELYVDILFNIIQALESHPLTANQVVQPAPSSECQLFQLTQATSSVNGNTLCQFGAQSSS